MPCSPASATGCARPSPATAPPTGWAATSSACWPPATSSAGTLEAAAVGARRERGGASRSATPTASCCSGKDVHKPEDALQLADQRMYEKKNDGRRSAGDQSKAVLIRALSERHPDLSEHSADVSRMAELVGRRARRPEEQLRADPPRRRAARRRQDRHPRRDPRTSPARSTTRSGAHAPAHDHRRADPRRRTRARAVARWCARATSAGTAPATRTGSRAREIPLGARIIGVCDAFDAMVSERPYEAGRSTSAALAELRRCKGTQFDPDVVDAFCTAIETDLRPSRRPRRPRSSWPRSAATIPELGEVAQLVEHTTENRGVAGSIPALATQASAMQRGAAGPAR